MHIAHQDLKPNNVLFNIIEKKKYLQNIDKFEKKVLIESGIAKTPHFDLWREKIHQFIQS